MSLFSAPAVTPSPLPPPAANQPTVPTAQPMTARMIEPFAGTAPEYGLQGQGSETIAPAQRAALTLAAGQPGTGANVAAGSVAGAVGKA